MKKQELLRPIDHCEVCDKPARGYYLYESSDKDMWVCFDCLSKGQRQQEASI